MLELKTDGEPVEPVQYDEIKMVRADQIRLGDLVDLEGDTIADADPKAGNHLVFETELQTVCHIEIDTPECIEIGFEGIDIFGFPVAHELKVQGFNPNYWTLDMAVDAFRETPNAKHAEILRSIATEYAEDGIIEDGTRDVYFAETEPHMGDKT